MNTSFTIYTSSYRGNAANCIYPSKVIVDSEDTFKTAMKFDHVCAEYKNNYRSIGNFIKSDCICLDCDNDHSNNPKEWICPDSLKNAFPDVVLMVSYSRHHMKIKDTKSARPRFHVYFPTQTISNANEYTVLKHRIQAYFPYFDEDALDSARFLFGTKEPEVMFFDGSMTVTEFMDSKDNNTIEKTSNEICDDTVDNIIPEGKRNSTLSHYAGRVLKRYGSGDTAYSLFLKKAEKCSPPLDEKELQNIWNSAVGFGKRLENDEDYIPPEIYNEDICSNFTFKPNDYSDVGQAEMLSSIYSDILRYSPATDYIIYNGVHWSESKSKAQAILHELTSKQLDEAETECEKAWDFLERTGASKILAEHSAKKAEGLFSKIQKMAYGKYKSANSYYDFVIKRRESKNITATLKEARPMLEIEPKELDADAYKLNTPTATYDLRKGLNGAMDHSCNDYITKVTAVSPSNKGMDIWEQALNTFFCSDSKLIEYVQQIAGLAAVGRVYIEALIIAYGDGRNGKSTFWNVISRVLGTYSGNISADTLTVGCKRNVKPELAEAKGKRLLIAAELEEGTRLNTSNVKQFCSTDEIFAEKKYKDPFSYIPSHTLVLYTNHLPKVGANDPGTWRRLIVIPFKAVIEGQSDIKNYADYLFNNCGEAILAWIIEGAKKIIAKDFKISPPECVRNAIDAYRQNNDWLSHFLSERCDIDDSYKEKSGMLYSEYRDFCNSTGEYTRSTADFYTALNNSGFNRHKERTGSFIDGLRIKPVFDGISS